MSRTGRILSTFVLTGAGSALAFNLWTRNSPVLTLPSTDPLFQSAVYAKNNPNKNPATQDVCIKKVPLSKIQPALLEDKGKLVESFCAGVWGGAGEFHTHQTLSFRLLHRVLSSSIY